jgi:hypothetical protein
MQFSRLALLSTLFTSQLLFACSTPAGNSNAVNSSAANSANAAQAGPKDNIEELGLLVRLPFEPEEVAWKEKPEQKKLIAVVRFSPENAQKMASEIAKNGQPSPETVTVESWFPNELIAQGELTGESIVKGQSYPAEPFLNPPYTKGKITRIENTDYFILQISS